MIKALGLAVAFSVMSISAQAATYTMDFAALGTAGGANASADGTSYTEDGMTMTAAYKHFDRYKFHPELSPDATDYNPVLHEGNKGSGVTFSLGGSAFDLNSIDVIGWLFGTQPVVTQTSVTFTSDMGGNHVLNATATGPNFTGLLDFSGISGFAGITTFSILMPNPTTTCVAGNNCPNFAFDNVTFTAPPAIPVPAAGFLLLGGLGMMAGMSRRRRS